MEKPWWKIKRRQKISYLDCGHMTKTPGGRIVSCNLKPRHKGLHSGKLHDGVNTVLFWSKSEKNQRY